MSVLPKTSLRYTLGIRRDKNIYGQGERAQKNPFSESRGRTRMAGEKRIDLFDTENKSKHLTVGRQDEQETNIRCFTKAYLLKKRRTSWKHVISGRNCLPAQVWLCLDFDFPKLCMF